jgi:hypothetical protein
MWGRLSGIFGDVQLSAFSFQLLALPSARDAIVVGLGDSPVSESRPGAPGTRPWAPSKMWARVADSSAGGDARTTAGLETGATRKATVFMPGCEVKDHGRPFSPPLFEGIALRGGVLAGSVKGWLGPGRA